MNKWGGTNDMPQGWTVSNKRIYQLWIDMLRRCYDDVQLQRSKGKSYAKCEVCEDWKNLSAFANDIMSLPGYEQWKVTKNMVLDKDILCRDAKIYSPDTCCFVPASVNLAFMNKENPNITRKAIQRKKAKYNLSKDGETLVFDSETDACEFLGVKRCSVAGSWRDKCKCKGYAVTRIGNSAEMRQRDNE